MSQPKLTASLASTIDQLVAAERNPSHAELTEVFRRSGVITGDPLRPGMTVCEAPPAVAVGAVRTSADEGAREAQPACAR
jgi:hypothetical protein